MKVPKYIAWRPDVIRVMGRNFSVTYQFPSPMGDGALGLCNNAAMTIDIQEGQHPIEEADTLLHEVMHAVWFVMSASMGGADEEVIVRRMSTGLTGIFMDNPHFLRYLIEVQKEVNQPN
jgi:hypothetical protein